MFKHVRNVRFSLFLLPKVHSRRIIAGLWGSGARSSTSASANVPNSLGNIPQAKLQVRQGFKVGKISVIKIEIIGVIVVRIVGVVGVRRLSPRLPQHVVEVSGLAANSGRSERNIKSSSERTIEDGRNLGVAENWKTTEQ